MGHSNIRSTMEYIHVAKVDLGVESPVDILVEGVKKDEKNTGNIE